MLRLYTSGYGDWLRRGPSAREQRVTELRRAIRRIWREKTYGCPRIHAALRDEGERVGRKRMARLMWEIWRGDPMPSHAGPAGRSVRRFFLNRASSWPGEWRIHRVKPFPVSGDPATTLRRLRNAVAAMPRTRIETATESHLHAVCRTRFLRFRDDLEFRYSAGEHVVHVQSASRWGLFDFGVNRRRVERVRKGLRG